jgi:large subunit ribosomal protein L13
MNPKTFSAKPEEALAARKWWVVNAEGKVLGRLASQLAVLLRGKHKPTFTPHVDTGDFVVVVNAGKVKLTGNKLDQKFYYHHSTYPGGLSKAPYRKLIDAKPELIIQKAVKNMLPKNVLGRQLLTKLKVYRTPDHPHAAQQPKPYPEAK